LGEFSKTAFKCPEPKCEFRTRDIVVLKEHVGDNHKDFLRKFMLSRELRTEKKKPGIFPAVKREDDS